MITLFFALTLLLPTSHGAETTSPPAALDPHEVQVQRAEAYLDGTLNGFRATSRRQRFLVGGIFSGLGVIGGAIAITTAFSPNPAVREAFPLTFGIMGGVFLAPGLPMLLVPGPLEYLTDKYNLLPHSTRVDKRTRIAFGESAIEQIEANARFWRHFYASLLIGSGVGGAVVGIAMGDVASVITGISFGLSGLIYGLLELAGESDIEPNCTFYRSFRPKLPEPQAPKVSFWLTPPWTKREDRPVLGLLNSSISSVRRRIPLLEDTRLPFVRFPVDWTRL